jgi:hypothetical protein
LKKLGKKKKTAKALYRKPKLPKVPDALDVARQFRVPRKFRVTSLAAENSDRRPGPTSLRLTEEDKAQIARLRNVWNLEGNVAVLRKAMEVAERYAAAS